MSVSPSDFPMLDSRYASKRSLAAMQSQLPPPGSIYEAHFADLWANVPPHSGNGIVFSTRETWTEPKLIFYLGLNYDSPHTIRARVWLPGGTSIILNADNGSINLVVPALASPWNSIAVTKYYAVEFIDESFNPISDACFYINFYAGGPKITGIDIRNITYDPYLTGDYSDINTNGQLLGPLDPSRNPLLNSIYADNIHQNTLDLRALYHLDDLSWKTPVRTILWPDHEVSGIALNVRYLSVVDDILSKNPNVYYLELWEVWEPLLLENTNISSLAGSVGAGGSIRIKNAVNLERIFLNLKGSEQTTFDLGEALVSGREEYFGELRLENGKLTSVTGLGAITNPIYISLFGNQLSAAALNQIFTDLREISYRCEIQVQNNPGSYDCDPSIAEAKGWTVRVE